MTPGEYRAAIDGIEQHQRMEMRRTAWTVAQLINGINPQKGKIISVEDLLKEPKPSSDEQRESPREIFEKLKREFEKRLGRKL